MNLVSLLLGKLRVDSHQCFSFLPERKAEMLPQLALLSVQLSCTYELNPPWRVRWAFSEIKLSCPFIQNDVKNELK